ncbi:hypothetical protein HCUR_01352 [Holospora curviuscula]|uniref:Uncharacterized protein n=1 Tax=Holospora curviuscula TaxID=1082868 RepID=A0A2S5R7Q3_9PROT|nr:hypothetical protein HCUR_01352 [Holospora curviuscula]
MRRLELKLGPAYSALQTHCNPLGTLIMSISLSGTFKTFRRRSSELVLEKSKDDTFLFIIIKSRYFGQNIEHLFDTIIF